MTCLHHLRVELGHCIRYNTRNCSLGVQSCYYDLKIVFMTHNYTPVIAQTDWDKFLQLAQFHECYFSFRLIHQIEKYVKHVAFSQFLFRNHGNDTDNVWEYKSGAVGLSLMIIIAFWACWRDGRALWRNYVVTQRQSAPNIVDCDDNILSAIDLQHLWSEKYNETWYTHILKYANYDNVKVSFPILDPIRVVFTDRVTYIVCGFFSIGRWQQKVEECYGRQMFWYKCDNNHTYNLYHFTHFDKIPHTWNL